MKGSTTLEAAIVIPIVLISIMVLIYLMFYLHDEAILSSLADEYLQVYTATEPGTHHEHIYENPVLISKKTIDELDLFLLTKSEEVRILVSTVSYPVFIEVSVTITLPCEFFLYDEGLIVERKKVVTSGSEIVRVIECLNDISSDFEPLNQAKVEYNSMIESLINAIKD